MEVDYMWLIAIIVSALIAFLPASIAQRKGRSFGTWYVYGFLLWIIAIFHAISLPELTRESHIPSDDVKYKSVTPNIQTQEIDLNAPIEIIDYEIVTDQNSNVGFNICFRNLYEGIITAVKFEIRGLNSFDEIIQINGNGSFISILQDLHVNQGDIYENNAPISLPSKEIRKLNIVVKQVRLSDGRIIANDQPHFVLPILEEIHTYDQIKMAERLMSLSICYPKQEDDYWICACGRPNKNNVNACARCHSQKEFVFNEINEDSIIRKIETEKLERKQAEDRQRVLQEEKAIITAKRTKKYIRISLILIVSIGIPLALANFIAIPFYNYHKAQKLISENQFDQAEKILVELKDYKDSPKWIIECNYQNALFEIDNKNFDHAIEIYSLLDGYKDSITQIEECHYLKGKYSMDLKQYQNAINEFKIVIDYKDSASLINNAYYEFALECYNNKEYAKAFEHLNAIPITYKNWPELAQKIKYELAKEKVKMGDYQAACQYFSVLASENYKDSKELHIESLYLLVQQKIKIGQYQVAKDYIKPLIDQNYKDSKSLYKETIKWRFEGGMCSSTTSDNRPAQIKTSFSKFDDFRVAGLLTGGENDEKINVTVIMTFPSGVTKSDVMSGLGDN